MRTEAWLVIGVKEVPPEHRRGAWMRERACVRLHQTTVGRDDWAMHAMPASVSVWTPGGPVAERASCASEASDGKRIYTRDTRPCHCGKTIVVELRATACSCRQDEC